jgi:hypothetical protein
MELLSGRNKIYPKDYRITPFEVHGSQFIFMDDG